MLADARSHNRRGVPRWSGSVQSCDRRRGVAERFGKMSQWALYHAYQMKLRGVPGFGWANPANRPGQSSHERRSDGVAYPGPVGRLLEWWGTGIDVSEAEELVRVLNHLGYHAHQPYDSPSEEHHVNLTVDPTANLKRRRLV